MAPDNDEAWAIAEGIQQQRPGWLVTWGRYTNQFVAYPLFSIRRRVIVTAYYPSALTARMDEVEQRWRIWPDQHEGSSS
jgi:hypothetical protein